MRICQSCFAEGITGEICPFCGAPQNLPEESEVFDQPSLESIQEQGSLRFTAPSDAQELFPGMLIEQRYTVQQKMGVRDGWGLYQVVDQLNVVLGRLAPPRFAHSLEPGSLLLNGRKVGVVGLAGNALWVGQGPLPFDGVLCVDTARAVDFKDSAHRFDRDTDGYCTICSLSYIVHARLDSVQDTDF